MGNYLQDSVTACISETDYGASPEEDLGQDISGTLQGAGGIGGLLSVTRVISSGTATYFPLADANGNITEYVDASGTVVAHREDDPFGNTIVANGAMVNDFNFLFSTKYWDWETGKGYWGYRWYDPITGRWTSQDPIGEQGGLNLYGMVWNDPADLTDTWGLFGIWLGMGKPSPEVANEEAVTCRKCYAAMRKKRLRIFIE